MKQRHSNGKYRINYFERFIPVIFMLWTMTLGWSLQTGNKLKLQVQARGGDNASWVETANATTPTPTPQQEEAKGKDGKPNLSLALLVKPVSPTPMPELRVFVPEPVVPTVTPTPTSKQAILAYIVEKFGDDSADFITLIRKCENSTFDQTRSNKNRNGTVDYGVAQVNSIHIPRCGEAIKTDWKANIDCAYGIYERAGKTFRPWTCAYEVGQKNYLQ